MSNNSNATASVNLGGFGSLVVFAVLLWLKVNPGGDFSSPVENWSWWIITMPLWIGLAFMLAILAIGLLIGAVAVSVDSYNAKKRRNRFRK